MRVGIDGRSLAGPQDRGVTHVTRSLVAALAAGFPGDRLDVLVPGGGAWAPPPALDRANVRIVRHPVPSRLLFGAAALTGRPRLDRLLGGVDVLWIPAPAPLASSRRVPLVLSVHDLSWVQRPQDFTAYERLWHALARPRRLAEQCVEGPALRRVPGGQLQAAELAIHLSAPGSGWTGARGRITPALLDRLPQLATPTFYLVGNGAMITELKRELISRGVNRKTHIRTEAFFD